MFRFWASDARGGEKTVGADQDRAAGYMGPRESAGSDVAVTGLSPTSPRPFKRRRDSSDDDDADADAPRFLDTDRLAYAKRVKVDVEGALPSPPAYDYLPEVAPRAAEELKPDLECARDAIQYQFGLEILLKHDELRLINQELAKCQVALEQLRRCHLIPYPTSCPTPQQMLDISSGKGPVLQQRPGQAVPRWAPPFGVVEGPYARHYAKWLIPDPSFDGMAAGWNGAPEASRAKAGAEGRATRNSIVDLGGFGKRPVRGAAGQKLHALSSGYPLPKDKPAPCVLKRSDGQTVKLVCIDCQRWDFSSTQGFINHCRIAHKRDFKSHEEAAVRCGHPIEADLAGGVVVGEEKASGSSAPGLIHPLARSEPITDQQAYTSLRSRLREALALYRTAKLPDVKSIPAGNAARATPSAMPSSSFVGATDTPYLSQLMAKRKFNGNLREQVQDAKTRMDLDDGYTPGDESEDGEMAKNLDGMFTPQGAAAAAARIPAVMRIPTSAAMAVAPTSSLPRPMSSKSRTPHPSLQAASSDVSAATDVAEKDEEDSELYDDMDVDLSPHTMTSNNAPSLVSDDGEYDDDSDDGSASEISEDDESVSDVAEINLEEDQDPDSPQGPRHHRGATTTAVQLRKDDSKHVTFVGPVTGKTKERPRKQTV